MSLICPQCSHENPDQSTFCFNCGNRLQSGTQSFNTGPTAAASLPPYASSAGAAASPAPAFMPSSNPPPSFGPPAGSSYLSYAPVAPPAPSPVPASPGFYPMQGAYPMQQMGTGQGLAAIRRAFAGYGRLIHHQYWLVSGGAEQAANARNTILDIMRQRNILGLNVNPQRLRERGVLMEERDYLVARRGVATLFIYTAPAGNDLYISSATTVLPIISNVQIIINGLLILLMILGFVIHPATSGGLDAGTLLFGILLPLAAVGILLYLVYKIIFSLIYWILEKDFWILLRPKELNDFQLDDIALLEGVTEDTAREAVKQVGLNPSQITPMKHQQKRRIRSI